MRSLIAYPIVRWSLVFLGCLSPPFIKAASNSIEELETVRANLSQALGYRDQAAKEQFAWNLRRGEMENLLLIATEEKKNLEATIAVARPILADLQLQKKELSSTQEESDRAADFLRTAGPSLAKRLLEQSARWPDPLLSDVREPIYQIRSILEQGKDILSDQEIEKLVQLTVEALEEALQFQNKIYRSTRLHTLPDGREALFEVVYIGLGGGYYLADNLNLAGKIVPETDGWKWVPQADLIKPLQAYIEILKEEHPTTWISLPVGTTTEAAAK